MADVRYWRRGTAIVETNHGILLTAGRRGKPFILPGGGAKKGESRFMAAFARTDRRNQFIAFLGHV